MLVHVLADELLTVDNQKLSFLRTREEFDAVLMYPWTKYSPDSSITLLSWRKEC